MSDATSAHVLWAVTIGAISAVSLPLGSLVGLKVRFNQRFIAIFAAFGAGALIAALSVELVAPTSLALTESGGESSSAKTQFLALVAGGVIGGVLFVMLDAWVNHKGGYLRKTSTTLAHIAKHRREVVRKQLRGVLAVRPFDALPAEMTPTLASMLSQVSFAEHEIVSNPNTEPGSAYIVQDGELDIEINGRTAKSAGPGALVGVLGLFVPNLAGLVTFRAKTGVQCLVLKRKDMDHLRALAPSFDQACRNLAAERMEEFEQHLITRLSQAVEWTRSTAEALRQGADVPAFAIRQTHAEHQGSPLAVWLGILLDGIPESIVIGAGVYTVLAAQPEVQSLRFAQVIPYTLVAGLFLSNFPEALSSSANMLSFGWSRRRIFLMWFALMVATALGAGLGFLLAGALSETWLVLAEGVAAGAMLTMIAAAMIPEAAVHGTPSAVGLSTLAGFLAAVMFALFQ
jgi:zinc transporter ZupT